MRVKLDENLPARLVSLQLGLGNPSSAFQFLDTVQNHLELRAPAAPSTMTKLFPFRRDVHFGESDKTRWFHWLLLETSCRSNRC
jgi:hypothetical protein